MNRNESTQTQLEATTTNSSILLLLHIFLRSCHRSAAAAKGRGRQDGALAAATTHATAAASLPASVFIDQHADVARRGERRSICS